MSKVPGKHLSSIKYLGGVGAPDRWCSVWQDTDTLVVNHAPNPNWRQTIPFASITAVHVGEAGKHVSGGRVLALGVFALFAKVQDFSLAITFSENGVERTVEFGGKRKDLEQLGQTLLTVHAA
jgi:hypothetical protein